MMFNPRETKSPEMPAANGHGTARAIAAMYRAAERAINTRFEDNPLGFDAKTMRYLTLTLTLPLNPNPNPNPNLNPNPTPKL